MDKLDLQDAIASWFVFAIIVISMLVVGVLKQQKIQEQKGGDLEWAKCQSLMEQETRK